MWIVNTDNKDIEVKSIGIHHIGPGVDITRIRIPHDGTVDQVKEAYKLAGLLVHALNNPNK